MKLYIIIIIIINSELQPTSFCGQPSQRWHEKPTSAPPPPPPPPPPHHPAETRRQPIPAALNTPSLRKKGKFSIPFTKADIRLANWDPPTYGRRPATLTQVSDDCAGSPPQQTSLDSSTQRRQGKIARIFPGKLYTLPVYSLSLTSNYKRL